jgi:hypothetical protein
MEHRRRGAKRSPGAVPSSRAPPTVWSRSTAGCPTNRIVRGDGAVRHLRATLAISEWQAGRPYRLVGSVQDLTERRWAEREIAARVAVTEALSKWKSINGSGPSLLRDLAGAMDCVAGVLWVTRGDMLYPLAVWRGGLLESPEFVALTWRTGLSSGAGLPGRAWERGQPTHVAAVEDAARGTRRGRGARGPEGSRRDSCRSRRRGAGGRGAIAERLVLSPATVRTHFENIYPKLGVSDKASAVAEGLRLGLIE